MSTYQFGKRSLANLEGVHPDLVRVAKLGITYSRYDFAITEGVRNLERQKLLVAQGYSKTLNSKHLVHNDGFGHAFDIMAVGDLDNDGTIGPPDEEHTWDVKIYTDIADAMQKAAAELGILIRWGGSFKNFFDGPHFELADPVV
jgi:peptidoglycan L-alanyl-D-glutamate endopeptidase CwlK